MGEAFASRNPLLGSWELDGELTTLRASDGFSRIFGWAPPQNAVPFTAFLAAIPDADRAHMKRTIEDCLRSGEPFDDEHRIVRSDGAVRVVRCRGQVVTDVGAGSVRLVGTTVDITDSKLEHLRLRQSEERFRALWRTSPASPGPSARIAAFPTLVPTLRKSSASRRRRSAPKELNSGDRTLTLADPEPRHRSVHRLFAVNTPFDVEYRDPKKGR